ncbi:energy-coupling factor transport system ATP-binding protein [Luteococcus japonicus]|uniref:Energy-coupling factor transport system ATP-binding protein n=1 Tax=Luteococcus japonicus TaxID=33984 RepID=A0A3N1ZSR2_9ACTN|nr:ABC transporter ATP-binding protein [Luteococcus japonicus]ROR53768.1 energy-coupling factor transport system ATP-binding protein [Luteococcus japonicus]
MITFDDVSIRHSGAEAPTLEHVDLTIGEGDLCLVVGRTGTGKSTLLGSINGLVPHFSGGHLSGEVRVDGRSTRRNRPRDLAEVVGFVGQNPLSGFVTDRVEDEVSYGMEQLGIHPAAMRKRVEETLDVMGIADLRRRPLIELSGGQQQRVAIAAVLAAQPRVVVLDEPTSALDPNAAADVLGSITTLVHEVGLTVVLAEHRLERVMQYADTVLWLPGDGSVQYGIAGEVMARADVVPPLSAMARVLGWAEVPLSVRDARRRATAERIELRPLPAQTPPAGEIVCSVRDLRVAYDDLCAVNGISLDFTRGSTIALMGRNGAGKSSLMWALQGATASSGEIDIDGTDPRRVDAAHAREVVSLVPQNASDLLYLPTVAQECAQADRETASPAGTTVAILDRLGVDLDPQRHPRDLSEGQRLALVLAIQLAARPTMILLDEPTRGLDYAMKQHLHGILDDLAAAGSCIVVSTHDVEFAAAATQRTIVMADGDLVADGPTRAVCTSSPTFAPQTSKVFSPVELLTPDELAEAVSRG